MWHTLERSNICIIRAHEMNEWVRMVQNHYVNRK